jgi:hypothetical protein
MIANLEEEIAKLKPWFEDIQISGVSTKSIDNRAGRNKSHLFNKLFDVQLGYDFFKGRSAIDLGCNAGGCTIEMLSRGATQVTCVEGNELSFRQLKLVLNSKSTYGQRARALNYQLAGRDVARLKSDLGYADVGMCLGLIYHLNRLDVVTLLRYLHQCTKSAILSSPITNNKRVVDWTVGREQIDDLLEEAGFSSKKILLDATEMEADWSYMTNTYYIQIFK